MDTSNETDPDRGLRECDLILKGGVTSGIVYPKLILELADKYRFRQIGGTSAGAIAAGITAAAEFNRSGGGFERVAEMPDYLRDNLPNLFQPTPRLKILFDLMMKLAAKEGSWWALGPQLFWKLITGRLHRQINRYLPANGYGVCPGVKQPNGKGPGLSDWLASEIERAGGALVDGEGRRRPLVFADLWKGSPCTDEELQALPRGGAQPPDFHLEMMPESNRDIDLRMVSSNLSLRRPNELPFMNLNTYFRPEELKAVLPDWVVDWMTRVSNTPDKMDGYRYLPVRGRMPVILAVRMSLSFPLLLSALPLYRCYFPAGDPPDNIRKMWFSDGGISSNFPIHLFDDWIPERPTFGVSLDEFDGGYMPGRVYLPVDAGAGLWPAHKSIDGVFNFASSIMGTAMTWQDQIQTLTPGFKERVVRVALDEKEGGLNLKMKPEVIDRLLSYGEEAGSYLAATASDPDRHFNFDDHRWRRFLILYEQIETELESLAEAWGRPQYDGQTFKQFLLNAAPNPPSYGTGNAASRTDAINRIDALVGHVQAWKARGSLREELALPRPAPEFKINARMKE